VCLCFEGGDESRGRRDEVAFRFELTRKLADWTAAGGEVVGGEWKKEWRNLSLFRFSFLVTALAAHDPARRQGMYGLRRQAGGVPVLIISLYRRVFEHATPGTSRLRRESRQLVRAFVGAWPRKGGPRWLPPVLPAAWVRVGFAPARGVEKIGVVYFSTRCSRLKRWSSRSEVQYWYNALVRLRNRGHKNEWPLTIRPVPVPSREYV
jgi:hypothetical protein